MIVKRVPTGIPRLDSLMEGGLIQGSANMVTGETGTGKTIFALQFLWEGLKKGDTCIYITLEESPEDIKADALQFGWDLAEYESKGLFRIIYHDPAQINNLGGTIIDEIKRLNAKRLVIDSTSLMALNVESKAQARKILYNIINTIKSAGCNALLLSEIPEGSDALSRFGVEEFVVDAVIVLNYLEYASGGLDRSLIIRKMRKTNHGKDIYPMQIGPHGIIIKPVD